MGQTGKIDAKNVFNGTFGYMYIDGEEVLSLVSCNAKDEITYDEVDQPGELRSGPKMTAIKGSGEFVVNKISNDYHKKWAAKIDRGEQPEITITSVEADPNALESNTMQFYGCAIGEIPYVNSASKTLTQDTFPFTFQDRKYMDPQ